MGKKTQPFLSTDLKENTKQIENIFNGNETLAVRCFENQMNPSIKCCIFYIEGMVNHDLLNNGVIKPFIEFTFKSIQISGLTDALIKHISFSGSVAKSSDFNEIIQAIVSGSSVLLIEGCGDALIIDTLNYETRAVGEPPSEKVLVGPREGFNESILANLTMVQRRLKTKDLKMKFRVFGSRTKTTGCICYIDGIAGKSVLKELERRLDQFSIDGTLDINYINEFICDAPYSPIQTTGSTERPDVVAAKLLEGRIALFLDGTPVVMTIPYLFIEHFQSSDDYYLSYTFASIGRLLRILGFFISASIPAIYVALTCFHHEMLPTPLLMSIAMSRQSVPLPTVVEAVIMLIMFEILRETGNRIPSSIGQSLSIVGALVIGQASVDAKLVSSPMIVIVATAGITGMLVPRLKGGTIIIRFALLGLASVIGLYGYVFGMMALLIYLFNLHSFGIPVMTSGFEEGLRDKKDIFVRSPWRSMVKRPRYIAADRTRSRSNGESG